MSTAPLLTSPSEPIELDLFLEALYRRYHYDFRSYSRSSLQRRVDLARERLSCETLSDLQKRVLHEPLVLPEVLDALTVQVSDLFRDPSYYLALRQEVIPHLRTFPSLKVWVAGCANGEELYSLAILFREEGLFDRTLFYATEINRRALAKASAGVYSLDRVSGFSTNYQKAGAAPPCPTITPPATAMWCSTAACAVVRCSASMTWRPTRCFPRCIWCPAETS